MNLFIFTLVPKQNFPPGSSHFPPGRRKLHIALEQRFVKIYFFPSRSGGEDYGAKKRSKLNLRGYCSQVLISSTIFATFTFLVFVFLCYNLDSSMLKCEGSLFITKFSLKSIVCRNNYMKDTTLLYPIF